ncbi:MAG: PASTA domain-containing protein, partial [Holophagae bacterium]|nr:PASTA domain-containing protein [Holophagae bacterium]
PGYIPYNTPWPLRHQCNNWYNIKLLSVENSVKPGAPEAIGDTSDFRNADSVMEGYGGGLVIAGNSIVTSGEASTYSACDSDGKAYTSSGSFSWISSMEDVLTVGESGNPVTATGFKAGTSTIILQHDGMMANFNVKVRARVPDVTSMPYTQAVGFIEEMNLTVSVAGNNSQSESLKNRTVLSQLPVSGTIVEAKHNVILRLSKKKKGNSLFSMSGGEKAEKGNSLFSISGGEKVEKGNLSTEYDSSKNQKENISSSKDGSGREMVEIQDPDELLGGAWTFHQISPDWEVYRSSNWEHESKTTYKKVLNGSVVIQFSKQENMYVGRVVRQGYISITFDAFGGRDHLLTIGKEVCWVMKTGKNVYQGEIFSFGTPGDKTGGKYNITIGVHGNAAKFLKVWSATKRAGIVSSPASEKYSDLMLRVPLPLKPGKKLKNRHNNKGGSIKLLN